MLLCTLFLMHCKVSACAKTPKPNGEKSANVYHVFAEASENTADESSNDDLTGTKHVSLELLANKNAEKQPLERLEKHKKVKIKSKATKGVLDCQAPSTVARSIRVSMEKLCRLGAIFVMGLFFICIFCNLCSRCEILHFISSSFLRLLPSLYLSLSIFLQQLNSVV